MVSKSFCQLPGEYDNKTTDIALNTTMTSVQMKERSFAYNKLCCVAIEPHVLNNVKNPNNQWYILSFHSGIWNRYLKQNHSEMGGNEADGIVWQEVYCGGDHPLFSRKRMTAM